MRRRRRARAMRLLLYRLPRPAVTVFPRGRPRAADDQRGPHARLRRRSDAAPRAAARGGGRHRYGFTDARFVRYRPRAEPTGDPVVIDYAGKRIPLRPRHTLSLGAAAEHRHGRRMARRPRTAGRHTGRRTHLLGRGEHPLAKFTSLVDCPLRLEHTRYRWPSGVATRGHPLRGVPLRIDGTRIRPARTSPDFGITLNIHI